MRAVGSKTSGAEIAAVPAAFYVVGLIRKDSYAQGTSLLAGEAVVDYTILMIVTKAITRRERASDRPVNGAYNDTFLQSNAGPAGKGEQLTPRPRMMSS
jgi:hypothetical protein